MKCNRIVKQKKNLQINKIGMKNLLIVGQQDSLVYKRGRDLKRREMEPRKKKNLLHRRSKLTIWVLTAEIRLKLCCHFLNFIFQDNHDKISFFNYHNVLWVFSSLHVIILYLIIWCLNCNAVLKSRETHFGSIFICQYCSWLMMEKVLFISNLFFALFFIPDCFDSTNCE